MAGDDSLAREARSEVEKAVAVLDYGAVLRLGRKSGERDFTFLRELNGKLQSAGAFSIDRLLFP